MHTATQHITDRSIWTLEATWTRFAVRATIKSRGEDAPFAPTGRVTHRLVLLSLELHKVNPVGLCPVAEQTWLLRRLCDEVYKVSVIPRGLPANDAQSERLRNDICWGYEIHSDKWTRSVAIFAAKCEAILLLFSLFETLMRYSYYSGHYQSSMTITQNVDEDLHTGCRFSHILCNLQNIVLHLSPL